MFSGVSVILTDTPLNINQTISVKTVFFLIFVALDQ